METKKAIDAMLKHRDMEFELVKHALDCRLICWQKRMVDNNVSKRVIFDIWLVGAMAIWGKKFTLKQGK